jgi:alpha-D-ribose 1-methylphosphonate 5-triphosphate synthase subunit PhnG
MAAIDEADAVRIARRIIDTAPQIDVISPPTVGMVMARAIDGALGETFNLGEVLVTEARVQVGGVEGWGMVAGSRPDHALAVAVVDAALAGAHPDRFVVDGELRDLLARRTERDAAAWREIAPTRVQFNNF